MNDFDYIKAAAIQILSDPARTFGRSTTFTLSDTVGAALVKATASAPLASAAFENIRRDILQTLRTPQSAAR